MRYCYSSFNLTCLIVFFTIVLLFLEVLMFFMFQLEVFHHFWKILSYCLFICFPSGPFLVKPQLQSWWTCGSFLPPHLPVQPGPPFLVFSSQSSCCTFLLFHPRAFFCKTLTIWRGFPGGSVGKNPSASARRRRRWGFNPWVGKTPWRRKWQLTPVFLPEKSRGQRSLEGYRP